MLVFVYALEQFEQSVIALCDSLTFQLESCAGGTRGGEGGTGLSDWFKRTCQASGHPAGLMGMVAKCSLAPKAMKAAKAMSCLRQPLGAVVSTEDTPQEELPLHLDACHSCAMREVGIDDGSKLSEDYLGKRRRA